jgi:F-type H+-transporting ATPase subunit b
VIAPAGFAAASEGGGFNPFEFVGGAAVWTWIIFLVALPLMWKFVFGPITRALEARDQKLEGAIVAADEARKQAAEQMQLAKAELDKARAEARRMVDEAVARAAKAADEERSRQRAEQERERKKQLDEVQAALRKARAEIKTEVTQLAMQAAAKVLRSEIDVKRHQALVEGFVQSLGSGSAPGGRG